MPRTQWQPLWLLLNDFNKKKKLPLRFNTHGIIEKIAIKEYNIFSEYRSCLFLHRSTLLFSSTLGRMLSHHMLSVNTYNSARNIFLLFVDGEMWKGNTQMSGVILITFHRSEWKHIHTRAHSREQCCAELRCYSRRHYCHDSGTTCCSPFSHSNIQCFHRNSVRARHARLVRLVCGCASGFVEFRTDNEVAANWTRAMTLRPHLKPIEAITVDWHFYFFHKVHATERNAPNRIVFS